MSQEVGRFKLFTFHYNFSIIFLKQEAWCFGVDSVVAGSILLKSLSLPRRIAL